MDIVLESCNHWILQIFTPRLRTSCFWHGYLPFLDDHLKIMAVIPIIPIIHRLGQLDTPATSPYPPLRLIETG